MATKKSVKKIIKAFAKSEISQSIADMVGLKKKQATAAIEALTYLIKAHLSKKGPGVFVFPGLVKFCIVRKPATKERKGKNPFTGELMTYAAKPARNAVKIKPLKKLKDAIK